MKLIIFEIMDAVIYRIRRNNGDVVMEGIAEDVYSSIFPIEHIGDKSLPYEIELRHFKAEGYSIEYHDVDIPWDVAWQHKS